MAANRTFPLLVLTGLLLGAEADGGGRIPVGRTEEGRCRAGEPDCEDDDAGDSNTLLMKGQMLKKVPAAQQEKQKEKKSIRPVADGMKEMGMEEHKHMRARALTKMEEQKLRLRHEWIMGLGKNMTQLGLDQEVGKVNSSAQQLASNEYALIPTLISAFDDLSVDIATLKDKLQEMTEDKYLRTWKATGCLTELSASHYDWYKAQSSVAVVVEDMYLWCQYANEGKTQPFHYPNFCCGYSPCSTTCEKQAGLLEATLI